MQSDSRKRPMSDIPEDLAAILKLLRQARERADAGGHKMLAYILRMAEAEAADVASNGKPADDI